jgi:O-methyltransferase involved in polyketide biosynthesis
MNLPEVAQSAILVLTCRVVESEKNNTVFNDPMAVLCLERLLSISSEEEKKRILRWKNMYAGIQARDRKARAMTARNFDRIANLFISNHPGCTVINLACGLDTRFWRIENEKCKYIELDLPGMIELKREILKDHLGYELIGCSVLDTSWIDQVTSNGNSNFLLLAEGLFYYLPRQDVTGILHAMAQRFDRSQLVFDMAPEKFTKGLWKRLMQLEASVWGLDVAFAFGMNDPRDIESYANGFKVMDVIKGSVGSIITVSINPA